jgi:hypothetical protein
MSESEDYLRGLSAAGIIVQQEIEHWEKSSSTNADVFIQVLRHVFNLIEIKRETSR